MNQEVRIEGIYDVRTLKHLKSIGVKNFLFDFNPKSFNFIQEHIFLSQLIPLLSNEDNLFFHFSRSNDPMIFKLIDDLKSFNISLDKIFFEFDEYSSDLDLAHFPCHYFLTYSMGLDFLKTKGENFKGFIFEYEFLEELYQKKLLSTFVVNFHTKFSTEMNDSTILLLRMKWQSNLISSLFEYFDFTHISLPINSQMEICYRNVDLNKLTKEMALIEKLSFLSQEA